MNISLTVAEIRVSQLNGYWTSLSFFIFHFVFMIQLLAMMMPPAYSLVD